MIFQNLPSSLAHKSFTSNTMHRFDTKQTLFHYNAPIFFCMKGMIVSFFQTSDIMFSTMLSNAFSMQNAAFAKFV